MAGPWEGHSALAAARGFLSLIDARRESFTRDVHVNTIITDGGLCPAILPDRAELRIEFRTDSLSKLERMDDIVKKCAHGAASAMDCTVNFTKADDDFADMVRVPVLEDTVEELLHEMGRASEPVRTPNGSSDVGNVSYHCPAIQPLLTIGDTFYALHTPEFREETLKEPAHQAIADGGKLLGSSGPAGPHRREVPGRGAAVLSDPAREKVRPLILVGMRRDCLCEQKRSAFHVKRKHVKKEKRDHTSAHLCFAVCHHRCLYDSHLDSPRR